MHITHNTHSHTHEWIIYYSLFISIYICSAALSASVFWCISIYMTLKLFYTFNNLYVLCMHIYTSINPADARASQDWRLADASTKRETEMIEREMKFMGLPNEWCSRRRRCCRRRRKSSIEKKFMLHNRWDIFRFNNNSQISNDSGFYWCYAFFSLGLAPIVLSALGCRRRFFITAYCDHLNGEIYFFIWTTKVQRHLCYV